MLQKSKASYSYWYKILVDSPKPFRLNLGGKIDGYFLELLEYIFVSLYLPPEQKITRLSIATSKLDGVKFFLQLAWENKCIQNEKYVALSEQLEEVGRMIGGWKKGMEAKIKTPSKP